MNFDTTVESFLKKAPTARLNNQEAVGRLVDILNNIEPDEVSTAIIEALNRYYSLNHDQVQALAAFFDQHLSD